MRLPTERETEYGGMLFTVSASRMAMGALAAAMAADGAGESSLEQGGGGAGGRVVCARVVERSDLRGKGSNGGGAMECSGILVVRVRWKCFAD
jgi:hypothetical protein